RRYPFFIDGKLRAAFQALRHELQDNKAGRECHAPGEPAGANRKHRALDFSSNSDLEREASVPRRSEPPDLLPPGSVLEDPQPSAPSILRLSDGRSRGTRVRTLCTRHSPVEKSLCCAGKVPQPLSACSG